LFEAIPPAESGLDFTNPLDTSHPLKRLFAYGYAVGGVAIGDLDDDGRPDLFFANGPTTNGLFLQTSSWRFTDATEPSGVGGSAAWATGASMVDIDNDGDLDLYVCNYDSPNQLFINDGKARFTEQAAAFGLDHVNASLMPTFCDYDRDGDLDLYILTNMFVREGGQPEDGVFRQNGEPRMKSEYKKWYDIRFAGVRGENLRHEIYPVGQRDRLFRNDSDPAKGTTTFTDVSDYSGSICAVAGKGLSATWWDYNDDGWPDLYVGNDFEDGDHLYLNNGPLPDGRVTFTDVIKEAVPHTTWYSMGADVGDVNNDGRLDFLSVDMAATTHFKQKASMGDMGSKTWFMTSAEPPQFMRNALYLNTGTPRFQEAAFLAGLANSDWSWSPKFGDYDSDGRIDLFVTNGMSRPFTESDIIKNIPNGIRVGKTDWDLFEHHPPQKEKNLAFANLGDLQFENTSTAWGLDHEGMSYSSAKADLDGDGHLDLVVGNLDEPVSLYRNRGSGGNRIVIELRGGEGPQPSNHFGIGAVVTAKAASTGLQIRQMLPVSGFLGGDEPALHFGLGDDPSAETLTARWPSGRQQV
ncbi:MAG: CRTAC1 family protein, partial [Verrucomicrobiales bacterium]|nr:CRTAC1 family protein [Verrucomicrobiales bacterium]